MSGLGRNSGFGRGRGQGTGGGRGRNKGGGYSVGGYCICAKCGEKIPHQQGVKCTTLKCPKCGHTMIREELLNKKKNNNYSMKIKILYDNTVFKPGLKSDWGFSCLVETHNKTILFDTGANGSILLENMEKLNVNPLSIDEVFISHTHFDHIGGLSAFLNANNNVKIYVPVSLRGIRNAKEIIYVDKPIKLHENIFSTGELEHIEQSMAVKTDKGLVLIVGCSHPKMENILKAASQFGKIYAIIGGLHGFNNFELFKDFDVICPTHCTQHIAEIKSLYPGKYIEGGAGKTIKI